MNTCISTILIFTSLCAPTNPASVEDPLPAISRQEKQIESSATDQHIRSALAFLADGIIPNIIKKPKDGVLTTEEEAKRPAVDYSRLNKYWKKEVEEFGPKVAKKYADCIRKASEEFKIPADIITAIVITESLGDPEAVSHKNAKGLMQTMPIIDKETGVYGDSFDPETSIRKGSAYLAVLKNHYGIEEESKMLVAYNEGPTRVKNLEDSEIIEHNYFQKVSYILENVL